MSSTLKWLIFGLILDVILVESNKATRSYHQEPPPPCSLNGHLVVRRSNTNPNNGNEELYGNKNNECLCDRPWNGIDCSKLNFDPVTLPNQGYGISPNITSWGGNVIFDGKIYHLFVATMTNKCTLRYWGTNSRIDHATSSSITGPYKFHDVAINTWSHNPAPLQLPTLGDDDNNNKTKTITYAIIHIGNGDGKPNGGKNCTSINSDSKFSSNILSNKDALPVQQNQRLIRSSTTSSRSIGGGSTIHVATSLYGPWKPLKHNTLGHCNNPSPFVHPRNGTIYIVCNNDQLKRSDGDISGPWKTVSYININHSEGKGPLGTYEDAFLYINDRDSSFHLLYHVYNTTEHQPHGHECYDSTVSAHVYSKDGYTWFLSKDQPYSTNVQLSSSSSSSSSTTGKVKTKTFATIERPKIFFDQEGIMTHLINGVCSVPNCPQGPPTGCVDCKYDSWDFTLIRPLANK